MRWSWLFLLGGAFIVACADGAVDSPYRGRDAGDEPAPPDVVDAGPSDAGPDENFGKPCLDDAQCDDDIDCTFDECLSGVSRCRNVPDHSKCADDVYCNGVEQCDLQLGCRPGPPVTCSDVTPCTVDSCVEDDHSCRHEPRDADGDGDADRLCQGEGDCNDRDPNVSSKQVEVCNNGRDDDCDDRIDESACELPLHDTCDDPFLVEAQGSYLLSTAALDRQFAASCLADSLSRDLVLQIEVPDEDTDVDIVVTAAGADLGLVAYDECAATADEVECAFSGTTLDGESAVRLRLRQLEPGRHDVVIFASEASNMGLEVSYEARGAAPQNETCNSALPLTPDEPLVASVAESRRDVPSICGMVLGELVYSFTLDEPRDVRLLARSLDGLGFPQLSLRDGSCVMAGDSEITCRRGEGADLFARNLPAGDYFVAVGATGPSDVEVQLRLQDPSGASEDEYCAQPPELNPQRLATIDLFDHSDDVFSGCLPGGIDAVHGLELDEPSDVLLIERVSPGQVGAINLFRPPCDAEDRVTCTVSNLSPLRTAAHNLPAGSYAVVSEASLPTPITVEALVRPAQPPSVVAFADTCAQAPTIPATGGFFQGNTSNASADYEAGCDLGAQGPGGARDQMLRLQLDQERRVIFDMLGSGYATLLAVRKGPDCPGEEVPGACAAGFQSNRSYLDLLLPAGEYFVQVDGFARDEGQWFLEVYIVDP